MPFPAGLTGCPVREDPLSGTISPDHVKMLWHGHYVAKQGYIWANRREEVLGVAFGKRQLVIRLKFHVRALHHVMHRASFNLVVSGRGEPICMGPSPYRQS